MGDGGGGANTQQQGRKYLFIFLGIVGYAVSRRKGYDGGQWQWRDREATLVVIIVVLLLAR